MRHSGGRNAHCPPEAPENQQAHSQGVLHPEGDHEAHTGGYHKGIPEEARPLENLADVLYLCQGDAEYYDIPFLYPGLRVRLHVFTLSVNPRNHELPLQLPQGFPYYTGTLGNRLLVYPEYSRNGILKKSADQTECWRYRLTWHP